MPRAQGQAMMSTATKTVRLKVKAESSMGGVQTPVPRKYQKRAATMAMPMTAGTKYPATTSASR